MLTTFVLFIAQSSFVMISLDDESYPSYRCRQNLFNTIHAFLTLVLMHIKFDQPSDH